ncbi:MAG: 16S rRNA processing protein RimM [Solirubrobacterales bacterium]|jgi:16S rRNA processing protein RimM|nr:16S rRNA processing protein RimM [Solirubrobacterales bacterium]
MSESAATEAGRVGRAHGLDGSFYVTRPLPALIEAGATISLGGITRAIERRAGTAQKPILRLAGLASREAIETFRGEPLLVARGDLPALEPGEYWAHELEGCLVSDGEREVGVVRRLTALPSCEMLEVRRGEGSLLLVPLVRDAVRSVDVVARRVDVDLAFLGGD